MVKDLSRFGRNYLEAGYYIETVFPFLGIRLIAVTDNFDSTRKEDMESLALPIRNIENVFVYDGGRIVVRFKYEQSIQDAVRAFIMLRLLFLTMKKHEISM